MKWWNELSSLQKTQICDTNTEVLYGIRRWETLTGREIEMLYNMIVKENIFTKLKHALDLIDSIHLMELHELKDQFNVVSKQNIPDSICDDFIYTGLSNIDFLRSDFLLKHGFKNIYTFNKK